VTKFFLTAFLCSLLIGRCFGQQALRPDTPKAEAPAAPIKKMGPDTVFRSQAGQGGPARPGMAPDSARRSPEPQKAAMPAGVILFENSLSLNASYNFLGKIKPFEIQVHQEGSADELFYFLVGLCFYFALIRFFFGRYVSDLFSLFFRASMRQQQIREQALQSPLPSLLLNLLFVLALAYYWAFLVCYFQFVPPGAFWMFFGYFLGSVSLIYFGRFCIVKLCGWIFNVSRTADNYIFVIFLVNKIGGMLLLPFLVVVSFSGPLVSGVLVTLSMTMIAILLTYRFVSCYSVLRSEIKLSLFHYFLYLCAFEIAPMLLIYKVALSYLKKAY
jgi:hypothetical protein